MGFETACHGEAGCIQKPHNQPSCMYPIRKCHKEKLQRAVQNYSRKGLGSRDMSAPWKSSLSWRGRNLRIQTSCHNIQIKHCLRQLPCEPELRFSHSSRLLCQTSPDTVAQLKPVKQDKSCLCQACTLQSTAEMTMAQDSAHAAGIKTIIERILRRLVHLPAIIKCFNPLTQKRQKK